MIRTVLMAALLATATTGNALAQRDPSDRALGSELSRERAETRIDRLRQDQRQNEQDKERAKARAQKPKQQQQR